MGNLSEHFNNDDFKCSCDLCRGKEFRIHLGLVGGLELVSVNFSKKPEILTAYWCEQFYDTLKRNRRSYHTMGKAAHIKIEGVALADLFKFAETVPGFNGIGLYPKEGFIHVDTRPEEKKETWVKEGESYLPMTAELRKKYGL